MRSKAAIVLASSAFVVSLLNAALLAYFVGGPDQDRILIFGLLLAVGPALIITAIVMQSRWLLITAGILFVLASFITGFSVGFWNLMIGVPLCAIAIALTLHRRTTPKKDADA